jgi:hypothetical protein
LVTTELADRLNTTLKMIDYNSGAFLQVLGMVAELETARDLLIRSCLRQSKDHLYLVTEIAG